MIFAICSHHHNKGVIIMTEKWPSIAILIPTYNRPEIVVKCIASLGSNLIYNYPGSIHFYVSIDGDVDPTVSALMDSTL